MTPENNLRRVEHCESGRRLRDHRVVSYSHIEGALTGVGFTEYLIDRQVVGDRTEATFSVHIPTAQITGAGVPDFDAVTVLRSLADALADIDGY